MLIKKGLLALAPFPPKLFMEMLFEMVPLVSSKKTVSWRRMLVWLCNEIQLCHSVRQQQLALIIIIPSLIAKL